MEKMVLKITQSPANDKLLKPAVYLKVQESIFGFKSTQADRHTISTMLSVFMANVLANSQVIAQRAETTNEKSCFQPLDDCKSVHLSGYVQGWHLK